MYVVERTPSTICNKDKDGHRQRNKVYKHSKANELYRFCSMRTNNHCDAANVDAMKCI